MEDKAISLATSARNRLKGMRRRAAKLLTRIKADSFDFHTAHKQAVDSHADRVCLAFEELANKLQSKMADGNVAGAACNNVITRHHEGV